MKEGEVSMRFWICMLLGWLGATLSATGQVMVDVTEEVPDIAGVYEGPRDTVKLTYVITGEVRDASTGKPLQYATVMVTGKRYGTVTNTDGGFIIKAPKRPRSLTFSLIGYDTKQVLVTDANTTNMQVKLVPNSIMLDEVIVRTGKPEEIVEQAIQKIPENYSRDPSLYQCFYREVAQKRKNYIYIAEAVTDMYKSSYRNGVGADRVSITKGRRLVSPRKSDTLTVKVIGGPVQAVMLDLVKNLEFLLNKEDLDCYEMKMEEPVMIADRRQYAISIRPRTTMNYALFYGTFYIDWETLAFTRIELSLDMSDREKATRAMLVNKPAGVRFRPRELTFLINYNYDGKLSHISYVRSLFRFNCDWKKRLLATNFTAVNEMVVTDLTEENVRPIPRRDSFGDKESLYDQAQYFEDSDFWKDYNIIKPTESLEDAVDKLKKKTR